MSDLPGSQRFPEFARLQKYKRTIADAVVDGVVPEGRLPTRDEMYRQSVAVLQDWITKVETADTN